MLLVERDVLGNTEVDSSHARAKGSWRGAQPKPNGTDVGFHRIPRDRIRACAPRAAGPLFNIRPTRMWKNFEKHMRESSDLGRPPIAVWLDAH